jgi:hypothetical protein
MRPATWSAAARSGSVSRSTCRAVIASVHEICDLPGSDLSKHVKILDNQPSSALPAPLERQFRGQNGSLKEAGPCPVPAIETRTIRLVGTVPPEVWNRLGTKILSKLRSGADLKVGVEFSVTVNAASAGSLVSELRQILQELGLAGAVRVE